MRKLFTLLLIALTLNVSAQTKQEVQDYKDRFTAGALFDVTGKALLTAGIISIVDKPKNNTDAIVLMSVGGSLSIIGTVFTIQGIKKSASFGGNKNGLGITINF